MKACTITETILIKGRRQRYGAKEGDSTQVHCVDLDKSFPTSIYLQNMASIQPRTSPCEIDSRLQDLQKMQNFERFLDRHLKLER